MEVRSAAQRDWIVRWAGLCLLGLAGPVSAVGLLPSELSSGHGISLSESETKAARSLGLAARALDAENFDVAQRALSDIPTPPLLSEYVDFERSRLLLGRGEFREAAALAASARSRISGSELARALARVEGDARSRAGEEEGARALWAVALKGNRDLEERLELRLSIIRSRQKSGELDPEASPESLLLVAFPDTTLPEELPPGERTPAQALLAAKELLNSGRSAEAIEVYREALAGKLGVGDARRGRFGLATALFRLREYDSAQVEFAALGDDPKARFWNARSLARRGEIGLAIEAFEELEASYPHGIGIEAAYLAGSLLEDRGQNGRALAHYEKVVANSRDSEQAQRALWRIGWLAWRRGEFENARKTFAKMQKREEDELLQLRPRYWAARSSEAAGDRARARKEFEILAADWRMSYYGWRAQQRLGEFDLVAKGVANVAAPGAASKIEASRLQRVALLLEADLKEMALQEIQPLLPQARSLADRIRVGRLLANAGDYYRALLLVVEAYSPLLGKGLRPGYESLFWLGWPPAYREFVEASLPLSGRVEPALVWAIMREESSFRPQVMSSAGARGLLQLMPETARRTAGRVGLAEFEDPEALFSPATNIALGSAYLDHLVGRFPTRLSAVIGSYNAGPTAVSQWLEGASGELEDDIWVEDIPYSQTRSYVKRVLRSLHVYRNFY